MGTPKEKEKLDKPKPFTRPHGRPTTYKPEYCQMLVEHMATGLGFHAFGAVIGGTSLSTLQDWVKNNDDFRVAKEIGESYSLLFWERLGRAAAMGQVPNFNQTAWIFSMKNKFGWVDRADLKISAELNDFKKEFSLLRDVPEEKLIEIAAASKDEGRQE